VYAIYQLHPINSYNYKYNKAASIKSGFVIIVFFVCSVLCNRLMVFMAGFGTSKTGFGTFLAMLMLMHATFMGTHAAYLFA
jgi:hypothetical protein